MNLHAPPSESRSRPTCGRSSGRFVALVVATAVWGLTIAIGLYGLWSYAHAPGAQTTPPRSWPVASRLERSGALPVLLLFAHPRCPCTQASIRELERLTTRVDGKVETHVVFTEPPDAKGRWGHTALRGAADALPNVLVHNDPGGLESELFHARTSGLALLYSADGELLFEGGLTASRGHEGDNAGVRGLASLILDNRMQVRKTNVFGCPLQTPAHLALQDSLP